MSAVVLGAVLSAWTLVLEDAAIRGGWAYFSAWQHFSAALGMYALVGVVGAVCALGLMLFEDLLVGRHVRGKPIFLLALRPAFYGLVGGLASTSTAIWTFSGEHAQKTALARFGPPVFASVLGLIAAVGSAFVLLALGSQRRRTRGWFAIALAFWLCGLVLARVDLSVFVALYSRVHTILELISALCLGAAYALVLSFWQRVPRARRAATALASVFAGWSFLVVLTPALRTWFDEALKHVWLEEAYVGRMLRRVEIAEAFLSDPLHWRGMRMARIERLKARYKLSEPSLAAAWNAPLAEPTPEWDALRSLRRGQEHYNVVVYYVDTLRADVASDPQTMPALNRFRGRALDFKRAYAAGSDTLRSLPVLTGGNYDALDTPENDILRVAKRAGYDDALAIAKSAFEFLGKLRPDFHFSSNLVVEDYPAQQQVWGYGAQQPTAPRLVDRAIDFLDRKREAPFFLWLFNFDQHNWRELDPSYVEERAKRFGISDDPSKQPYRYRAVARAIDHEFERLISALEQRNLLQNTILLFVSDHGEALGRDGFWVHSVFLWESLIRVPLVLYVPALPARSIENKVSLVDVAPTLGRYLDPTLDGKGFHGEDLLAQLLPAPPLRRFPLLLLSASKDLLVRVGLVDPIDEYKLVLSFEAALPELYDLSASDPDAENFASRDSARVRRGLDVLLHSPIFPHSADDFEVRDTRAQKALEQTSELP